MNLVPLSGKDLDVTTHNKVVRVITYQKELQAKQQALEAKKEALQMKMARYEKGVKKHPGEPSPDNIP